MKHHIVKRAVSLLLALVCILGILPLSAFAAEGRSNAPSYITQKSSEYMRSRGRLVNYKSASSVLNSSGRSYVFNEQVNVPGFGTTRALCSYRIGTLDAGANGQKWNFKQAVNHPSLKLLMTYVYSHSAGDFTAAGQAAALDTWAEVSSDIWFITAQSLTWYWEYGILKDVTTDRAGFIDQLAQEFLATWGMLYDTWNFSPWITNWNNVNIYTIIDSRDNGATGVSAYNYAEACVRVVTEHPEYYHNFNLWEFEWDKSQPWKIPGQSGTPMQRLLIAVPDEDEEITVKMTVKKLEAGTDKPISGVTFKIESADGSGDFSVTRETGADGTLTLTAEADGLTAGQYTITEVSAPAGYVAQTASQVVTVMPNSSVSNTFTFYNEINKKEGDGTIRKVDADNPTVGIPGAVIRITSVNWTMAAALSASTPPGTAAISPRISLTFPSSPRVVLSPRKLPRRRDLSSVPMLPR